MLKPQSSPTVKKHLKEFFLGFNMQGFILLSVQAHLPQLRPAQCKMISENCPEAKGYKALIFFIALYLVALGSGCLKPNIISHGADQFIKEDSKQSKKLSTYFNVAYFAFCMGELIALTLLVWVQTHAGMDVGFGVSAAAMAVGLISLISGTALYKNKPSRGSIFTPIAQVINSISFYLLFFAFPHLYGAFLLLFLTLEIGMTSSCTLINSLLSTLCN